VLFFVVFCTTRTVKWFYFFYFWTVISIASWNYFPQ